MRRTAFVGRTDEGARVYLELALEPLQVPATKVRVDHEQPTEEELARPQFSASGFIIERGHHEASRAGQCLDVLLEVTQPEPGWSLADLQRAHVLWSLWHLNGMRAACSHMVVADLIREPDRFGGTRIAIEANKCPVSDYYYGRAWLYEPLPVEVIDEVGDLMRRPRGVVPDRY